MLQVVAKESDFLDVMLPHECLMLLDKQKVQGKEPTPTQLHWFIRKTGFHSKIAYLVNDTELAKHLRRPAEGDKTAPAYRKA